MRRAFVAYYPKNRAWGADLLAGGMASALRKIGFEAKALSTTMKFLLPGVRLKKGDLVIGIGTAGIKGMSKTFQELANEGTLSDIKVGFYNVIETGEGGIESYRNWKQQSFDKLAVYLGREIDFVLDYSPHGEAWYSKALPVPAAFCPIGYDEAFEIRPHGPPVYGAVFLGRVPEKDKVHERRKKAFDYLDDHGVDVTLASQVLKALDSRGDPKRINLIKGYLRARIWLNLNRIIGWKNFQDIRIMAYGFSNRLCVVSEPTSWTPPIANDVHWFMRPLEEIPSLCRELLEDPECTEAVGQSAYEFIKRHWRFDVHLERALKIVGEL